MINVGSKPTLAEYLHPLIANSSKKIVNYEILVDQLIAVREDKKIAHCHGVFDLLHIGHIKHLEQAKMFCDILIVTVTSDRYVNKGIGRPYFTHQLRAEALAALACVDFVVINDYPTAIEAIRIIRPTFYVKGIEYQNNENDVTGKINEEEHAVKSIGGKLRFTSDIVFSSSTLLNRFFSPHSAEILNYLEQYKQKYPLQDIVNLLKGAAQLKVLVIGEAIIDVYHFGEAIGKSGKEPVLVTKYYREETYIGGVLAVANHLSSFCSKITCLTAIGEQGEYEEFIREKLAKNIDVIFQYKENSPTIIKKRYLEEYTSQKLFEIYEINDCYLEGKQKDDFINLLDSYVSEYDLVLVADYGHGLLDEECVKKIEEKSKFLAVNTQSNASNHGFNCVSKYKKANYVCIATRELQLNYRQKHISVNEQLKQLVNDYSYENVLITHGRKGSCAYKANEGIYEVPAFATTIKDRVGAGDAVLAITSLCVAQQAHPEVVAFIGNMVGAEAVNIMGNESFIEKSSLLKHILHFLK